jgi:hypothetical protein
LNILVNLSLYSIQIEGMKSGDLAVRRAFNQLEMCSLGMVILVAWVRMLAWSIPMLQPNWRM